MDDLILFTPSKESHINKYIEHFIKEWIEDITQEMPIIQDQLAIYGK